jgi:hypothetical protein
MLTNKIRTPGRPLPTKERQRVLAQRAAQPSITHSVPPWSSRTLSDLAQGRRPKTVKAK